MPRTLPRLLTPFRVQRPDTLPAAAAPLTAAPVIPGTPGLAASAPRLADLALDQPALSAAPACRGDSLLPPCGRPACPTGCAGSAA